jgi:AraC family transcriptional activator FtrA
MTFTGNIPPMKQYQHSVGVIISDGLGTFEFGIAVEVFGLVRPEFDFPWYKFTVIKTQETPVLATGGVFISSDAGLEVLSQCDTIVIPSWRSNVSDCDAKLHALLVDASVRGARFLSICSGAFLLAQAGLLNGKKATTHWKHIPKLKATHPSIKVQEDTLYTDEDDIICSAGSAAGIDACLHLVRKDFGAKIANDVARRLVAQPHRSGGQAQFIHHPVAKLERNVISTSMDWALANLSTGLGIKDIARHACMSERTFLRRFCEATGSTPIKWLQQNRAYKAQELLEDTTQSMEHIAEQVGYQSSETFRVAFKKVTGVSPGTYRANFKTK